MDRLVGVEEEEEEKEVNAAISWAANARRPHGRFAPPAAAERSPSSSARAPLPQPHAAGPPWQVTRGGHAVLVGLRPVAAAADAQEPARNATFAWPPLWSHLATVSWPAAQPQMWP